MPIRRVRLSAAECLKYCQVGQQLRSEGVELGSDFCECSNASPLEISDRFGPGDVFFVNNYCSGYAVRVHLLATSRVSIEHCVLQSKWHPHIQLGYAKGPLFMVGKMSYPPREVLNEKLESPWSLQRGAVVEGLILGYGYGTCPLETTSGLESVQITLTDSLGRESCASLPVFVSQPVSTKTKTISNTAAEPERPIPRRPGTLYDEPRVMENPKTEEKAGAKSRTASRKQPLIR